jgi:hypothetical protein
MHEQWKKRKMFSNREQGIMSGLDPVPMVQGGYVPYPGMQVGGVVPQAQLFEEGDNELNDALNNLASITKPDVPDMPMPMMEEKVEVKEEVTEDQGPDGFRIAVDELKRTFKSEIDNYIAEGGGKNLGKYLTNMNIVYSNELKKLKEKYDVTIESPEDQLFTEAFLSEAMGKIPGMSNGGLFDLVNEVDTQEELDEYGIQFPLNVWTAMKKDNPESAQTLLLASITRMNAARTGTAGGKTDTTRLTELLKERRDLAEEAASAAGSAYASTGSDLGELIGKISAAKGAKASTLDRALADEIAAEREALKAGTTTRGSKLTFPADTLNAIFGVSGSDKPIDLSKTFESSIEQKKEAFEPDPELRAIVDFADFNELPYFNAYRGKKLVGNTPTDWISYYKASLAQEKNKLGNKFPDKNSDPDGYYELTVQIVKDWNTLQDA